MEEQTLEYDGNTYICRNHQWLLTAFKMDQPAPRLRLAALHGGSGPPPVRLANNLSCSFSWKFVGKADYAGVIGGFIGGWMIGGLPTAIGGALGTGAATSGGAILIEATSYVVCLLVS